MDRATVYTSQQGRSVDFLFAQRATMIGLAKLAQAAFGTNTVVRGLAVTPNSPAALNVLVGIGEIYTMAQVDATTWGALGADTVDTILKQGLNMSAQAISTPAPSTPGYSINYLIEAQYQDQDTNPVVLPFYNSSNPQQPLNGQGGNGASLPTQRQGVCVIQAKAGVAATTGTQTTPAVDTGWTALAVVTVANGQSTVTSGNIAVAAGVPEISSLLQMMQTGSTGYAVDTSTTPNQITLALTPAITAYTDGQEITFKAANNNNGACTLNAGPGSISLVGAAGALQGGEIIAGGQYTALYSASLNEAVLNSQTAGAHQINPATKSQHAVQFGQVAGVVGSARNLKCNNAAAGTSLTFTADEIVAESALGGLRYCLANFNATVASGTTGLGGLDTGTTLAANSFYAVYAATKSDGTKGAFLQLEPAGGATSVYSGANLPANVVATALISVWPTNGSAQFVVGYQADRSVSTANVSVFNNSTTTSGYASVSIASAVPKSARFFSGGLQVATSTASAVQFGVAATAAPIGICGQIYNSAGTQVQSIPFRRVPISTPQTTYYQATNTNGTPTFTLLVSDYEF